MGRKRGGGAGLGEGGRWQKREERRGEERGEEGGSEGIGEMVVAAVAVVGVGPA